MVVRSGVAVRGRVVDRRDEDECYVYVFSAVSFFNKFRTSTYSAFGQLEPFAHRPTFLVWHKLELIVETKQQDLPLKVLMKESW